MENDKSEILPPINNVAKKNRWITKENLSFFMASSAFIWSIGSTPFENQHVLVSIDSEIPQFRDYESGESEKFVPLEYTVKNLGDKPIKVVEISSAFRDAGSSCQQSGRFTRPPQISGSKLINSGETLSAKDELFVPPKMDESYVCLKVVWKNHNNYEKTYLSDIGKIELSFIKYESLSESNKNYRSPLKDFVNVFGPARCASIFGKEICPALYWGGGGY